MNRWLPALLIFTILIVFRVMPLLLPGTLPNFQPLPAIILCSIIFLKGHQRWLLPLLAWIVTDPLTSVLQGYPIFSPKDQIGIVLGVAAIVGIAVTTPKRPIAVLSSSLLSAIAFYVITNWLSFVFDPLYEKSMTGFIQAQWTGPVGMMPTWIFLRNLIAANLLFSSLFLVARQALPQSDPATSPACAR
ncbi:MAG: hypothetical protein QM627_02675 [Luteolibacter sp.]